MGTGGGVGAEGAVDAGAEARGVEGEVVVVVVEGERGGVVGREEREWWFEEKRSLKCGHCCCYC